MQRYDFFSNGVYAEWYRAEDVQALVEKAGELARLVADESGAFDERCHVPRYRRIARELLSIVSGAELNQDQK